MTAKKAVFLYLKEIIVENLPDQIVPAGINEITDEVVRSVHSSKRLFPEVVLVLTERTVAEKPDLDRLPVMRQIRDELISRLGSYSLNSSEVVE
jgi:hypothetical protein